MDIFSSKMSRERALSVTVPENDPLVTETLTTSRRASPIAPVVALIAATLGPIAVQAAEPDCKAMSGRAIPASVSKLPTSGGTVTSADFIPAAGAANAYCKVVGQLNPVDPLSWPILFEINLPEGWNGKAVQYGGGGTNGRLIQAIGPTTDAPPTLPTPLAQGFVTFGTDAGHPTLDPDPQIFAFNTESVVNQAYASYKKTYDTAKYFIKAYYNRAPRRVYFFGDSEGGRESMLAVQRYPEDYDGVVAIVPAMNWTGQHLAHYREWMLQQNGGWISPAKLAMVQKAEAAVCDNLDGLADGVIGRYEACAAAFNPASIRCPEGKEGEACLSDPQVALLVGIWSRKQFPFSLANGLTSYPPSLRGGEAQARGMIGSNVLPREPTAGDLGRPLAGPGSIRYFFARDPNFKGPFDEKKYQARIQYLSGLFDVTNPDLRAFAARGGKFLIKENASDYVRSPVTTFEYYDAVVKKMGKPAVDQFVRLYVNPGAPHFGDGTEADGTTLPNDVDLFGALDAWVDAGQPPPAALSVGSYGKGPLPTLTASRPLCQYHMYPHYIGGDAKLATSFTCRQQN